MGLRPIVVLMLLAAAWTWPLPGAAQTPPSAPYTLGNLPVGPLRAEITRLPPEARARAVEMLNRLRVPPADLPYLRVDRTGRLFYADPPAPPAVRSPSVDRGRAPLSPQVDEILLSIDPGRVLELHSKPGASRTVYLNFVGKTLTGSVWNPSGVTLQMLPYSLDEDRDTIDQTEANTIAEVWKRMAEDYAPFDIDVTTEPPPAFGPQVGEVLFSPRFDKNGVAIYGAPAGGVAYVDVWGRPDFVFYQPALVFPEGTGSAKAMAEAGSHELGHNLALLHDGTATEGYYAGQGTGNVSWGPLMGVGYYTNVTQWSKGEYAGANNQQDDVAIITERLGGRADDHGDTPVDPTPLVVEDGAVTSGTPVSDPFGEGPAANRGVIGTEPDVDVFSIDIGKEGTLDLTVAPVWVDGFVDQNLRSANLDVRASLFRQSEPEHWGDLVATDDPADDTYARVTADVTPGRYLLLVDGVGVGDPAVTGYSDYGSLGQYFISGTVPQRQTRTLTVVRDGSGEGTVTSAPAGIDCGTVCEAAFEAGAAVTLTAAAASGSEFSGWSGACEGSDPTCVVEMSAARTVTAVFAPSSPTVVELTVLRAGTGSGVVTSAPAGIRCGGVCSATFDEGTLVTLTATAARNSVFAGWSGSCSGVQKTCKVQLAEAATVTARFRIVEVLVSVQKSGLGSGAVRSTPARIDCGPRCSGRFPVSGLVTLAAKPGPGSAFGYWRGACSGATPVCRLRPSRAATAVAVFNVAKGPVLAVVRRGEGTGVVSSGPAGILCGPLCAARFPQGARVVLRARADTGSTFVGWSGPCKVQGVGITSTCTVSMSASRQVVARFRRGPVTTAAR